VDLYELLKPQASTELLYYRDDTHWTPRGHQLVADLLAEHLAPNPAGSAAPNVTRVSKAP
jgi:lysophospholipase L1-like esterase